MKYIILIGDGMGDYPIEELGGKTPLMFADTPQMDYLAQNGLSGLIQTVPNGMAPGSDVAIMSLMGYNPKGVLTGRAPLEAKSQGVDVKDNELVFRMNLVTLEKTDQDIIMRNHAAGNISTEEAIPLLEALREGLGLDQGQRIFSGVSFRHILTWPNADNSLASIPPHDFRDKSISHIINDKKLSPLMDLVKKSWEILDNHPINIERVKKGLQPANSIWLWGQGVDIKVPSYEQRWGLKGATVSAVDLIKGLGASTGLETINVKGATGWIDTNYEGKVRAALDFLKDNDYVVLHIEAPDEASHQGEMDLKLQAIMDFDQKVVGPMVKGLESLGSPYRLWISCDHFTPLALKTHTCDPVPFIMYEQGTCRKLSPSAKAYDEQSASETGIFLDSADDLSRLFFGLERINE